MQLSRRTLMRSSMLGLAMLGGGGAISACSTSTSPKSSSSGQEIVLWTWPEGFGQPLLDAVAKEFPDKPLRQDIIGGDFKQKLTTTFTAGSGLPDITGVKGEDIAFFRSHADYFADLNTLGAQDLKGTYLEWKWAQATTIDGKQLGVPIDIGPTALFYRFDVFEEAGLPSDPDELGAAIRTWDEFFELGKKLIAARPETYLIRNLRALFDTVWPQSGKGFVDESGAYIGDGAHIRQAWDTTMKAYQAGITAGINSNTADAAAAVNEGRMPADFGASWHLADLMSDAPETSGKWHVCQHPGDATNLGGSFLTIPAGAKDPKTSMEFITFILNPANQVLEYVDKGNFPATPQAFADEKVIGPVEFLGGQRAGEIFAAAAETVPVLYEDPNQSAIEAPFLAELESIEGSKKDPEQAWDDAVAASKRIAEQVGLTV